MATLAPGGNSVAFNVGSKNMTLLASWIGIDTHGPSSIYIASDSRLSWSANARYDHGRKVFASAKSADIFGYCGDVLFPSMALSQIVDYIDAGLLFPEDAPFEERSDAVIRKLRYQFSSYPSDVAGITAGAVEILHASRDYRTKEFFCNLITWRKGGKWKTKAVELPSSSDVLFVRGSGASAFYDLYQTYQRGPNASTSRNVFHCVCDSILNSKVASVGGAPQLSGIIRKPESSAIDYGIIAGGNRYHLGCRIDELKNFDRIEWRNERFEICDGASRKRRAGAQPQPNPQLQ